MIRSKNKGVSVIELLLASALVGLVTTMVFAAYWQGLRALFKGRDQSELLTQLQLSSKRIATAMSQGSFVSVSMDNVNLPGPARRSDAVSFLTAYDINGTPRLNGTTAPDWTAYLVFYHNDTEKRIMKNRIDLRAGSPQNRFPSPIDRYFNGTARQPITAYRRDGTIVARNIRSFGIDLLPTIPNGYEITLEGFKQAESDNRPDSQSKLKFTIVLRN